MNPILLNPKINSDASTAEQLRQMKSYLYQFKEEVELILMNIDSDNLSEKCTTDLYESFSKKLSNSKTMTEILQTAGAIKMSVKDLDGKYSQLSMTVGQIQSTVYDGQGNSRITQNANAISAEVSRATGVESALRLDVNGISASYISKDGTYNGVKIDSNGITCNAGTTLVTIGKNSDDDASFYASGDGSFEVYMSNITIDGSGNVSITGDITATSGTFTGTVHSTNGDIGGFTLGSNQLTALGHKALSFGTQLWLGDILSNAETWVWGTQVRLQSSNGAYGLIVGSSSVGIDLDTSINGSLTIHSHTSSSWKQYGSLSSSDYVLVAT